MKTVSDFYKSIFGQKVYKISLDAGCTCPNRDGTISTGGCLFCSATGSGDFTPNSQNSITEQISQAKQLLGAKYSNKKTIQNPKYIAYFQNFTNTYGNPEKLYTQWKEALTDSSIVGIAIGTRPDCLSNQILQKISLLAEQTFLQVELGLQTCNQKTADYLNRGFTNQVYQKAIQDLHNINPKIHVVTHIIFGLPTPFQKTPKGLETKAQMLKTVKFAVNCGTDGIKITSLYILKNSGLEKSFLNHEFQSLTMDEYFEFLTDALKIIPQNIIIHRLTGDPPKSQLIEPQWTTNKKRVLNEINKLILLKD